MQTKHRGANIRTTQRKELRFKLLMRPCVNIIIRFSLKVYSGCHKYVREYECRIHLAPCFSNGLVGGYPCRELCHEIHTHCPQYVVAYNAFKTGGFYPSRHSYPTCFWPEVTCPKPEAPLHDSVEVEGLKLGDHAIYWCNILFYVDGENTRTCQVIPTYSLTLFTHPNRIICSIIQQRTGLIFSFQL